MVSWNCSFLQNGMIVQHTSVVQKVAYFAFSPHSIKRINTGSDLYIHSLSGADSSTVSSNLTRPRPLNSYHNW